MSDQDRCIGFARIDDLPSWMDLVELVRWNFPGLETEELLEGYRQTVIKNMDRDTAICARDAGKVIGVLLFSVNQCTLSCMAVHPDYRRQGIASGMIRLMLERLPAGRDVQVITFREGDEKGIAPRALYKSLGFVEGEFCNEFDYPEQKFILHR
ncbi:acetyltransferases [Longilinea arvoryzae]|uniref:Acetyltransferases n=1 Tax=Longilinea arvoryzae TaxID=360412 RepID=A0A0S7BJ30_9CHLR|nr:GNAT family N-acetyltransferase [Longilinea arvoryzae]GAP14470.1 acetyltransferases [Longilinea arvoryzae]